MNPNTDSRTDTTTARQVQRVRHELRFRNLAVLRSERLSPSFVRVVLGGEELEGFYSPGFDDHIKLIFPDPHSGAIRAPVIGPNGPVWEDGARPLMRDYTPRTYDAASGELAIDFALHEAGPATAWALQARPGDRLGVGGPRGSMLVPTDFDWHLLVGDETALPAIARRLAELPAGSRAIVLAETDTPADQLPLPSPADVQLHWLHRHGESAGMPGRLLEALSVLALPDGDGFVWVACEGGVARVLRAQLLQRGLNPRRVKASGYWRRGAEGSHETIED